MPYIEQEQRIALKDYDWSPLPQTAGELNYVLTRLIDRVLGSTPTYNDINSVIGVLECAKLEAYRRIAAPYEDRKCLANGDVYMER